MIQRIQKLDELTSSKIAAGEVVEKPAMIVKELFENSVDAGSTEITVEIERGGKQRIRVSDNGSGIPKSDLQLAFERHATSKISTIDDLYYTKSFGFRGEALASIAAVSKVTMTTRTADEESGSRIVVAGGELIDSSEVAATVGTTVEITDLFFNTPVRLKFLKADAAEQKSVVDLIQRLAIANTDVSIRFLMDGEQIFLTDGRGDLASAIYVVFGRQVIRGMNRIQENVDGIQLRGFASNFSNTRGNRNYQFVFVNGRVVQCEEVRDAIALAYRPYLMKNNYPLAFLFLDLHPSRIDVNIHPAKTEIKFEDPGVIKQLVYTALKKTFNLYDQIPRESAVVDHRPTSFERFERPRDVEPVAKATLSAPEKPDEIRSETMSSPRTMTMRFQSISSTKPTATSTASPTFTATAPSSATISSTPSKAELPPITQERRATTADAVDEMSRQTPSAPVTEPIQELFVLEEEPAYVHQDDEPVLYSDLLYVGTLADTYLLYQKDSDLYLIDQHAAHEKILFERFMDAYRRRSISTQMLLFPLEASVHEGNRERIDHLESLGFHVQRREEHMVFVDGIPSEFPISAARVMLRSALDPAEPAESEDPVSDMIAERACKMAIKAHDVIADIERSALLAQLANLRDPYNCPHGRPIIIRITSHEIEKRFRRIV